MTQGHMIYKQTIESTTDEPTQIRKNRETNKPKSEERKT